MVLPKSSNISAFLSIFANGGDDNGLIMTDGCTWKCRRYSDGGRTAMPQLDDGGHRSTVSFRRCQCVSLRKNQPLLYRDRQKGVAVC